ncbi:N-acetylmuramoyl-L-alanine amidase [Streptomyces sp.]|uniref:N-acetylmuramoyl-L-alanine amidase n=1 Tax=Streptomyces sp. TaxID=1931 RepID=UPI002F421CFD
MFSNKSRGGGRGSPFLIAVAVTAAACVAGWLLYGATTDSHADSGATGGDPAGPVTRAPSSPGTGEATASPSAPETGSATAGPSPAATAPAESLPLTGRTVVLDPGHNPGNASHTTAINRLVDIGTGFKECDTTGTATDAGYAEASYTLDVSRRIRTILLSRGARVTLTQNGDRSYGPCVDERARIGNRAHADVALSVHADGGPASGRGFHVIAPAALHTGSADTRTITAPSYRLATALRARFKAATGEPYADYTGGGTGLTVRDDLGGLNLSTVPKVFIECGNMRNSDDAEALTDPAWRQDAARGIADALTAFLLGKR